MGSPVPAVGSVAKSNVVGSAAKFLLSLIIITPCVSQSNNKTINEKLKPSNENTDVGFFLIVVIVGVGDSFSIWLKDLIFAKITIET